MVGLRHQIVRFAEGAGPDIVLTEGNKSTLNARPGYSGLQQQAKNITSATSCLTASDT